MVRTQRFFIVSIVLMVLISACAPATSVPAAETVKSQADLGGIKTYLTGKIGELKSSSTQLKAASDTYYELAQASGFDYVALWTDHSSEVSKALLDAKSAWLAASPLYEQMEGIVAGTPSLAEYDVILDAGGSGEDDPENAVPFDITLPDGRVLPKPGNLFGVLETTLWGTNPDYVVSNMEADLDANGTVDFGEALPDANILKGAVDLFDQYVSDLDTAIQAWIPTESDAFTSLVVMVPTMNEYFESWKNSRFVAGDASTQSDFVAISRLADIQDILSSLQVVYVGVKPLIVTLNSDQATQIENDLGGLKDFVADVYKQEQDGKRFTAEEADLLGAEAQNRATAIAGQISQVAASLGIAIEE
ncbi:MAG: hypothetical protein JNM55_19800 [Anaerolineales bacterium]|nr:hypothetical protein [Anaerolineales bacterium]